MYKETNFELISTGETATDGTSAEDGGLPLQPSGPLACAAPVIEHPAIDVTADLSVNGTLATSALRAAFR